MVGQTMLFKIGLLNGRREFKPIKLILKFGNLLSVYAQMWHKAIWKGHPMRLELTRVGLLVELANHYTTRGA